MKKRFLAFATVFAVVIFISACGTFRGTIPSQIGLLPLVSYGLADTGLPADTTFRVIRDEKDFKAVAMPATTARQPAFSRQMVVAILFKNLPTNALQFERAEVTGTTMNVYAATCTGQRCVNSQAVLATTPKVGSVKSVRFIINGESRVLVDL